MKQVACVFALLGGVLAVGSIGATEGPQSDGHLTRTIAVDLVRVPLSDLCWVVEQRTGIAHRVADPATGDLLTSVVGKLTVAQLQQALADVLGVAWKQSGEAEETGYVAECIPARLAQEAREQAEADRMFREELDRLVAAASLSDEALAKLPMDLRARLRPGVREALQLLGDLAPEEQSQVFAGSAATRALDSLPPIGQARVRAILEEHRRGRKESLERLRATNSPLAERTCLRELPGELRNGAGWRVRIGPEPWQRTAGVIAYMVTVFGPGEPGFGTGLSVSIAPPATQDPARYRLASSGAPPKGPLSVPLLPDQYRPQGSRWEEVVHDLERTLQRPIVSDAYLSDEYLSVLPSPVRTSETLESYLDRACRFDWNRRWGRVDPVLTFQRMDWAVQRRAQIPSSQARRWKQHIIDTGRLRLEDLLEMASLTPYQLSNLQSVLGPGADLVAEHRDVLLLWKAMPNTCRRRARAAAIAIRDLPLGLQPRARLLVSTALGSSAPLVLANAQVKVEAQNELFTFSVLSPDRQVVVRRVELKCPPFWVEALRREAEARATALRAAAGGP